MIESTVNVEFDPSNGNPISFTNHVKITHSEITEILSFEYNHHATDVARLLPIKCNVISLVNSIRKSAKSVSFNNMYRIAPGSSRIETHFPAQVVVLDSIAKLKFQVDNRGKLDQTKSEPYSPTMIMSEARAWLNPPHTGFAQSLQGFHCPADIPWMVLCMEVSRV